jgi:hypothetical protein
LSVKRLSMFIPLSLIIVIIIIIINFIASYQRFNLLR